MPAIDVDYADMYRRQYLSGVGTGVGSSTIGASSASATDHVSVEIVETNAPVEGGDYLEVIAEIENRSAEAVTHDVDLVIGSDPDAVARRTVSIEPNDVVRIDQFRFATYPVRQDDEFPIVVEAGTRSAETMVDVEGIAELESVSYNSSQQPLFVFWSVNEKPSVENHWYTHEMEPV